MRRNRQNNPHYEDYFLLKNTPYYTEEVKHAPEKI